MTWLLIHHSQSTTIFCFVTLNHDAYAAQFRIFFFWLDTALTVLNLCVHVAWVTYHPCACRPLSQSVNHRVGFNHADVCGWIELWTGWNCILAEGMDGRIEWKFTKTCFQRLDLFSMFRFWVLEEVLSFWMAALLGGFHIFATANSAYRWSGCMHVR